jgi:hypothetical protein
VTQRGSDWDALGGVTAAFNRQVKEERMPKRVDANQAEIVRALRAIGATVQPRHDVGKGCPELLVGFRGENFCLEVKDGAKPRSRQALTEDEEQWEERWQGQYRVVRTVEEALRAVGATEEAGE